MARSVAGVISISTSYAKQESVIQYDQKLAKPSQFHKLLKVLGIK
jgi:hypothetical protein